MHNIDFDKPANVWEEAMPLGNGSIGAMICGNIEKERIYLNEDSIWSSFYIDRNNKKAKGALCEIQNALLNKEYSKAYKLSLLNLSGIPENLSQYQPVGDLRLSFAHKSKDGHIDMNQWVNKIPSLSWYKDDEKTPNSYHRSLDLKTGTAIIKYSIDGINYTRESFISYPDNVMVINIKADKLKSIYMSAKLIREEDRSTNSFKLNAKNTITLSKDNGDRAISFLAGARIVNDGGSLIMSDGFGIVEGANEVMIILTIQTTFKTSSLSQKVIETLNKCESMTFNELKDRHVEDYRKLYNRSSLEIESVNDNYTTAKKIERIKAGFHHPEMVGVYYNFARYLMISSSRTGSLPSNLQGIWNME